MLGYWKITDIIDAEKLVKAESTRNTSVIGLFYLPPLNRASTSNISVDDIFFGVLDIDSGYGALLCITQGNDFAHKFDYDLSIGGELNVTNSIYSTKGNIESKQGDCIATTVSLKQHTHAITTIYPNDVVAIAGGVASVTAGAPAPVMLETTYTIKPKG